MFRWLTERRRRHLLERPFPEAWRGILEANVAAYALLDPPLQQRLRELVQVFVAEKHWEGCGGLELTDEIRVTIAGCACLMILGRDHDLFGNVISILVYPSGVVEHRAQVASYTSTVPISDATAVWGLSHRGGAVVLSWDSVLHGARDPHDGRNLVFHELAHKIDELDGVDGTPPLPSGAARRAWGHAFEAAFLEHRARAERGEPSLLRDYAITNEAEYFAVATEVYFEQPDQLQRELPEVYAEMRAFYGIELRARNADGAPPEGNAPPRD